MEPIHPPTSLDQSLLAVTAALLILLTVQYLLGHWDAMLAVAEEWYVAGVMGLWGR